MESKIDICFFTKIDRKINFTDESDGFFLIERSDNKMNWSVETYEEKKIPLVVTIELYSEDEEFPMEVFFQIMVHKDYISDNYLKDVKEACGGMNIPLNDISYQMIDSYGGGVCYFYPIKELTKSEKSIFLINKEGLLLMKEYDISALKKLIIPKLDKIFKGIYYLLDRTTRRMGTTGWDEIDRFIKDKVI